MKKSVKIITLVLSLALALCAAIGFAVSAETAESTTTAPVVLKKNVMSNGNFCLMFALDPESCGDNIIVEAYNTVEKNPDAPEANRFEYLEIITAEALNSEQNIDLNEDGINDEVVMIQTQVGVSASDIADTWHVYFTSNGQTTHVEYSVKDYAFERLYADFIILENDSTTKAYRQKQFYLSILEIGSTAQNLLVNWDKNTDAPVATPERLAKEYSYASIQGGTFNDRLTGSYVEIGDILTLTQSADNTEASWKVYTYDTNGNLVGDPATVEITDGSATVTVAGNTVIVPGWAEGLTPGKYFADIGDEAYGFEGTSVWGTSGLTTYYKLTSSNSASNTSYGYTIWEEMEGYGNVLGMGKEADDECQPAIYMPVVDKAAGQGNVLVFEADMLIRKGTMQFNESEISDNVATSNAIYFTWQAATYTSLHNNSVGSANRLLNEGFYMVDTDAATLTDGVYGGDGVKITASDNTMDVKIGEWHQICFEYYFDCQKAIIYIDGVQVANYNLGSGSTTDVLAQINSVSIASMWRLRDSEVVFDNVFSGKIVKEYPTAE